MFRCLDVGVSGPVVVPSSLAVPVAWAAAAAAPAASAGSSSARAASAVVVAAAAAASATAAARVGRWGAVAAAGLTVLLER